MELLQNFYETTLDALRDAKNERLWFKTMTKLGKLYFDRLLASSSTYLSQSTWLSSQGGVQQAGQDSEAAEAELPNWGGWGWSQEGNSVAWGDFTIFIWWDLIRWNRCMPLRSRCTRLRRITRNWKPCTIKASTSNRQFPILLSLESSGYCQIFMFKCTFICTLFNQQSI